MGLISTIKKALIPPATIKAANPFLAFPFLLPREGRGRLRPSDYAEQVRRYRGDVFSCANLNAVSVAQVPLRLYVAKGSKTKTWRWTQTKKVTKEKQDYLCSLNTLLPYTRKAVEVEEVTEHPFLDLMRNVNPIKNEFDLKEETVLYLELTGNSYWYLVSNNLGTPEEIWILPSQKVTIVPDRKIFIKGYIYNAGGMAEGIRFEPEEVIHFKYPNPDNLLYGMSPLMGAADEVDLNYYMRKYQISLLQNRAMPGTILTTDKDIPDDNQRKRIERAWYQAYGGPNKAGKVAVLGGGFKPEQIEFSPKELAFLASQKNTREKIANAFGIPIAKLTTESVNRANAEAAEYAYMKDTVQPRLRRMEQKINEKLLPRYDEKLFCAFDNPVPLDREARRKDIESHLESGYTSVNEERQKDGLEEAPWGEVPILPMNVMPFGSPPEKEIEEFSRKIARKVREKLNAK